MLNLKGEFSLDLGTAVHGVGRIGLLVLIEDDTLMALASS